jgi:hypothetical protein
MPSQLNGNTIRQWREDADMGLNRAAVYVSDMMGYEISSEYIRRMETEAKIVDDWDPVVVLALAAVYRRKAKDLPAVLINRVERIRRIIDGVNAPDRLGHPDNPQPPRRHHVRTKIS